MAIHESGENYLEAILMIEERQGNVRSIDVVNQLGFSKPTVSVMVHKLEDSGFITITQDGFLKLTEAGLEIAEKIYERHTVLTSILIRLGVPEDTASEDACLLEHDLSEVSFDKIKKYYYARLAENSAREEA